MGGTKGNISSKIKNFTEKDQVRVKHSIIGKDKKLVCSVYIGEDVYNQLTEGKEYKKLKVMYIPGDMIIISPTNDDKGIVHRYNGTGACKTTCVRISLSSFKNLKILKRDYKNKVVMFNICTTGDSKELKIDISSNANKKPVIANKTYVDNNIYDQLKPGLEAVLTNTKADKKPDKSTYIPRMDHKLDEINEKVDEIIKNQKSLSEAIFSVHELLTSNEKDEHNKPDIDIRNSYDSNIAKQKIEGAPIPYIPFNDLDEIHEKVYEIQEKQEYIAKQVKDFNNTNHDISYRLSLLLQELEKNKEKDDHNRPDIDRRIAFLEASFSRLELALEEKDKSLFEKIFGK